MPPTESPAKVKPNPNARLLTYRKLHTWFGLFAAIFLVVIAATGIYLNHKNTFQPVLELVGAPPKGEEHAGPSGKPGTTAGELAALPIALSQALDRAGPHLGDRPVERVEVKPEHGRVVYKVKAVGGPEVVVDAVTGVTELKGEKKEPRAEESKGEKGKGAKPKPEKAGANDAVTGAPPALKGTDWGKALKDLHTGKVGGDAGKLLVDLVAVGIIVLTLTGIYLWAVPALRKRRSARARAALEGAARARLDGAERPVPVAS
ncbi:PepSY-associated TM helix [Gemmata sp. SH-PL17]|uniref:PepSY-associated TM helix domain-containing protein n=1 Tax=Gemmata sp. SH-PL17 TaxID=1630693 RepID=UPI0004BBA0D8|nr:PepSY-associated TM helix domain-containing protein [Gemmata sp. SH-PL17]AMV28313.1 PepSY-associated TM helix [Gemmata sp. SH-PL17]